MSILVDSGNCKNIGDNAMLINVINYLAGHFPGTFYVIDKGVSLNIENKNSIIKKVKSISSLLRMPHWRIFNYKSQPLLFRHICMFLFWFISILRAFRISVGILVYRKYKKYIFLDKNINYWVKTISNVNCYWVVGGGNINDIWVEQAFWKMAFAWLFKIQKKPVIFSGQGIGPANRIATKNILKFGIKYISMLSVREKLSYKCLEKMKINMENIFIVGDDALTITSDASIEDFLLPEKFIALNIRISNYSAKDKKVIEKIVNLVELLLEEYKEHKFIFIPIADNESDSDISAAKMAISKLEKHKGRLSVLEGDLSYRNIKLVLEKATMSIGISYHFCLFSLAMGTFAVGLYANDYYEQKLEGLFEMFGVRECVFGLKRVRVENLLQGIKHAKSVFNKKRVLLTKNDMENKWHKYMELAVVEVSG